MVKERIINKYLPQIAQTFNVSFHKLVTPPAMVNYGEIRDNGIGQVSNLYQENKELYNQLLNAKEEAIKAERAEKEVYKRKYENLKNKLSGEK